MEIQLEKQKMDAMRDLSSISLKISEARNTLTEIREAETGYLVEREDKAMTRIKQVIEDSEKVLAEALENYASVTELSKTASELCNFLTETLGKVHELREMYEKCTEEQEVSIKASEYRISELQKAVKIDRIRIENDKKSLELARKTLEHERKQFEDEKGVVERKIKRLKEGRI